LLYFSQNIKGILIAKSLLFIIIAFMQAKSLTINKIYVPIKRRSTLNQKIVDSLAEEILEEGQKVPIQVRQDGERLVLIEGLHRLEACRALGENSIMGILVRARLH
jgi:uncharacterized ParB-like nuclease family protein